MPNNSLNDERILEEKARAAKEAMKKKKTRNKPTGQSQRTPAPKKQLSRAEKEKVKRTVLLAAAILFSVFAGVLGLISYFVPQMLIVFKISLVLQFVAAVVMLFVGYSQKDRSEALTVVCAVLLVAHVVGAFFMIRLGRFQVDEIVTDDQGCIYEVIDGDYYLYSCGQDTSDIVISQLSEEIAGFSKAGLKEKDTVQTVVVDVPGFRVDKRTFNKWKNLTSVTFTGGNYSIGKNAFKKCTRLESVTFEEGDYTFTGGDLFKDCTQLRNIYLKNGNFLHDVTEVSGTLLDGVGNLTVHLINAGARPTVRWGGASELTVIAYKGTTSIGSFGPHVLVFEEGFDFTDGWTDYSTGWEAAYSAAPEIFLPTSVTQIPEHLFGSKTYSLDIYYQGSKEMWNNVEIADTEGGGSNSIINNSRKVSIHYNSNCTQWENPTK